MKEILYNPLYNKMPVGGCLRKESIEINLGISKKYNIYDVRMVINKDYSSETMYYNLKFKKTDELYNYYYVSFSLEREGLYWYCFEIDDCYGTHYLSYSESLDAQLTNEKKCWQLTIYKEKINDLKWFKGKVMYQIMVDRFYNGGFAKNRSDIILHKDWNDVPNYMPINGEILNNDFFGGDLLGVIEKLDYLKELNVSVILFNPIFQAYSNHKYDTADYLKIDPMFGNDDVFKKLCDKAKGMGIYIILDGVFNHSGSDSIYFNKNGTFNSLGAYQSINSPYYDWYTFYNYPNKYECWWNFLTLPRLNQNNIDYLNFITGKDGVVDKWMNLGAKGFRLDVVDEYNNNFLDKLKNSIKKVNKGNILIGEVWEDASNKIAYSERRQYFTSNQLDSVMNYPFRNAILDFIKNENIYGLRNTIRNIINNYPKDVLDCLMNCLSTHDTIRTLNSFLEIDYHYLSKKEQAEFIIPKSDYYICRQKLKMASLLQFTLPGVPCIYYGDEVGLDGFKDPFSRKTMPWDNFDEDLLSWYKFLGKIRKEDVFTDGIYKEEICERNIFSYSRNKENKKVIVIINNSNNIYIYNIERGFDCINEEEIFGNLEIKSKSYGIIKVSN